MAVMQLRGAYNCGLTVALVLLICACGKTASGSILPPTNQRLEGAATITAEWLAKQPGTATGDFSFHLLDADNRALPWHGLSIKHDGDSLVVSSTGDPPPDAYLYVAYDFASHALDVAELEPSRATEYLVLAVPGRIPGVLPIALSRMASSRNRELSPGPLLRLRFSSGSERVFRSTSSVSDDPADVPVLELDTSGGNVNLNWDERNLGDYNNNGEVGISDLTPLGAAFLQQVNGDPKLQLIDGDENGELNIADISKIGRNFGTTLDGYTLLTATGDDPADSDFHPDPVGEPTILRSERIAATDPSLRKQRLQYSLTGVSFSPTLKNWYYVKPWSATGSNSGAPHSNTVIYDPTGGNQPPVWESTVGLTSATGLTDGLRLTFGRAVDPEGGAVDYVLRYIVSPGTVDSGSATEVVLPAAITAGNLPFVYDLTGLTPGVTYNLRLRARDPAGEYSANGTMQAYTVPKFAASADPWPYRYHDLENTNHEPTIAMSGPLELQWSVPATGGGPLLSSENWAYFSTPSSTVGRVNLATQALEFGIPSNALGAWSLFSTDNGDIGFSSLPSGGNTESGIYAFGDSSRLIPTDTFGSVLLAGSLVLYRNDDGLTCFDRTSLLPKWTFACPDAGNFGGVASDGQYIYVVGDLGRIDKLNPYSGASVASAQLPAGFHGRHLVLDTIRQKLYASAFRGTSPPEFNFHVYDTADLSEEYVQQISTSQIWPTQAPVLVSNAAEPFIAWMVSEVWSPPGMEVRAFSLLDYRPLWNRVWPQDIGNSLTADATRIYLVRWTATPSEQGLLSVLDFEGRDRQIIKLAASTPLEVSHAIPSSSGMFTIAGSNGLLYGPAVTDLPPVWQGTSAKPGGGIRAISADASGDVTVDWDYATDDHGAPVRYAVYWRVDNPPDFDSPTAATHIITDIADNGTGSHSYTFDPGVPGRIYAGVRAYDAPWDDSPKIELNTNWLAVTPGWAREDFKLGGAGANDLPAGEVYFMRGVADPAGQLHLVYNDKNTVKLTHVFGTTGAWNHEESGLAAYPCNAFDPAWDNDANQLTVAVCDGSASVLRRTGPDTWTHTALGTSLPVANPQIALAYPSAGDPALAYTQFISGVFPNIDGDYYASLYGSGAWPVPSELDTVNYSGRDIDLDYYQGAPVSFYQLGLQYAPNRLTPQDGSLWSAAWDGTAWMCAEVDPGANGAQSDCGKRVQAVVDGDRIHVAYMDLDGDADNPVGELKYGLYDLADPSGWGIETWDRFDLSFQPGSSQYTWGEIGLAVVGGKPAIGILQRTSGISGTLPHMAVAGIWRWNGVSVEYTKLNDGEFVFPSDREPCVLLADSSGKLHLFIATTSDPAAQPPVCDMISHFYEL